MVVTSLAVAVAELPPVTFTVLVTEEAAFDATLTVTVMTG
jgi:hypothetical protein